MATLRSPERKSEFHLDIERYQLLKPVGEVFDDNWLILKMAVATPERRWAGRGPYLTTFELAHLIDRMRAWAGRSDNEILTFTANNLAFGRGSSSRDLVNVRVGFDLDCNPDFAGKAGDPLWVRFDVTPAELIEFAAELGRALAEYPERHLTRGSKIYKSKSKPGSKI